MLVLLAHGGAGLLGKGYRIRVAFDKARLEVSVTFCHTAAGSVWFVCNRIAEEPLFGKLYLLIDVC